MPSKSIKNINMLYILSAISIIEFIIIILLLVFSKKYKSCSSCCKNITQCPIQPNQPIQTTCSPNNPYQKFDWTIPKPPVITKDDKGSLKNVVVYVSSGLFNLYENIYSLGLEQMKNTAESSILADYIPDLEITGLVKKLKDSFNVPDNGMAGECARKGWYSYIPARDGFNMAFLMSSVSKVQLVDIQKVIPEITSQDWIMAGTYLLSAVYGFDMYNLISRCNAFIFNSDGIAMDDGSCVELGLGTNRGLPIVIYRTQQTSNFPGHVINPMVEGASGTSLNTCYSQSIPDAISNLDKLIRERYKAGDLDYCNVVPPPIVPSYWCNVGYAVWSWKYKQYIINSDGTLNKDNYSDEYMKFLKNDNSDLGKALIVAKIITLVKDVQKKYNVVPQFSCSKKMTII